MTINKIIKKIIKTNNINKENYDFNVSRIDYTTSHVNKNYEHLVAAIRSFGAEEDRHVFSFTNPKYSLQEKGIIILSALSVEEYQFLQDSFREFFDQDLNRTILTLLMSSHQEIKDAYNQLLIKEIIE